MRFLALEEVLALHAEQIRRFGGAPGLRDPALLASALAMPRATFGGEPLHATPWEAAAAYLFHLARNHPFVDGNKRAAFLATGLCLALNGWRLTASQADATVAVMTLAAGELEESAFAAWLRSHIAPRSR